MDTLVASRHSVDDNYAARSTVRVPLLHLFLFFNGCDEKCGWFERSGRDEVRDGVFIRAGVRIGRRHVRECAIPEMHFGQTESERTQWCLVHPRRRMLTAGCDTHL